MPNTSKRKFNSHAVTHAGAQEIPSDLEPILFMDAVHADLEAACPTGIDKCECMHAPGTFTNGPFNPREDPIGAMINFVGCAPGNVETIPMTHNLINLYYLMLSQDIAFARIVPKKSSMLGHNFSVQYKTCVQDISLTGHVCHSSIIL